MDQPQFELRRYLYEITGVDLTSIEGISPYTALIILSEIGCDMSRWPSVKHFGSWLCLAPGSKISGGRVLSRRTKPGANRAANILRLAAQSLAQSRSALGAYYRRLKGRIGAPKALTATAYKLARLIYSMLKNGTEYTDMGQAAYEAQYRERRVRQLERQAHDFGYVLVQAAV